MKIIMVSHNSVKINKTTTIKTYSHGFPISHMAHIYLLCSNKQYNIIMSINKCIDDLIDNMRACYTTQWRFTALCDLPTTSGSGSTTVDSL